MHRQVTKKINECFAEKAAITLLTEGESKRKYQRKRIAQSFCSPDNQPRRKKKKTHSPNFENVPWDSQQLKTTLRNWPTGNSINWSVVGREHGISGGNAGQIAKEFAEAQGIDISTATRKPAKRSSKRRLPGSEVSIPCNPPLSSIQAEISSKISSGRFVLGEECAPYTITKYKPVNGKLSPHDTTVHARKVPLKQIRERLLKKHLKYMRLTPSSTINAMTRPQLTEKLQSLTYVNCETMSWEELSQLLASCKRTRSLCVWHDHATMLKMGFIMITVHIMYDPMVFYTDTEYQEKHPGDNIHIQSEVEQPEIYFLSAGSSSIEDQAALIGDRTDCLKDLSIPITTDNGIEVIDRLRFFTGDHPAAQFEQGSKQGGTYKCGMCGCNEQIYGDQGHSQCYKWRSLELMQSIATADIYGKEAGSIKPFDQLKVDELKSELRARGKEIGTSMLKPDLRKTLHQTLRGVVRVPSLLLANPTQSLSSLNLDSYEIIASEPLHDIKGHIMNIITELPHILPPGDTAVKCTHLIDCCLSKEKKSGADLRRTAIQLYLLLKDLECSSKVVLLLQTIVKIDEISYSREHRRSPQGSCYSCTTHVGYTWSYAEIFSLHQKR